MPRLKPPAFSGTELGYAELTANFGPTTGVANTIYTVTGLSITVVTGLRPVIIEAYIPSMFNAGATADTTTQIWEDGSVVQADAITGSATANKSVPGHAVVRRNPAAGSHTYDVRVKSNITGAITVTAGVGFPAWIQVREV